MISFHIIDAAMAVDAERISLIDGNVEFTVRGERLKFECSDAEYRALWAEALKLELNSACGHRAMAPQMLPETLRDSWTLRVYVGPNIAGNTNVLLEPLPTRYPASNLSSLLINHD